MVMIDLTEEKKSLGVISVTRVTKASLYGHGAGPAVGPYLQVSAYVVAEASVMAGRGEPRAGVKKT